MKKILSIFILCAFISCDNELDINEEWQDIPVLYAILNSGTGIDLNADSDPDINYDHFVRVQKSFLGSGSAYDYTHISDSIYYNSDDLEVFAQTLDTQSGEPGTIFLVDLIQNTGLSVDLFKEDGIFSSNNHYLYKFPSSASNLVTNQYLSDNFKIYKDCNKIYFKFF